MKKRLILILAIILAVVALVFAGLLIMGGSTDLRQDMEVTIDEGSSTAAIGEQLDNAGIVRSGLYFRIFSRLNGLDGKYQAGTYSFASGRWTTSQVCEKLIEGGRSSLGEVKVTIVEGLTVKQIAQVLADAGLGTVDNYLDYAAHGDFSEYSYIPEAGTEAEPATRLEGFLFPDTYMIDSSWSEEQIFDMLLAQFAKVWEDNGFQAKADERDISVYDAVTMASLVEKEAKVEADRPLIAGVFYKRMDLGMLLESCATVQFILGEPKTNLTYADISIDNPYNTYINAGLPPGPIACPGKASLNAALNPEESDYLYFRAKTDGSHRFSKTFEEHSTYQEGDQ